MSNHQGRLDLRIVLTRTTRSGVQGWLWTLATYTETIDFGFEAGPRQAARQAAYKARNRYMKKFGIRPTQEYQVEG